MSYLTKSAFFLGDFSDLKFGSLTNKMYGFAKNCCASYLFLFFCSLSLGDLGKSLAINQQKWSPLESLYMAFFFLCMILTADFLDGVQGRASSKCNIHFCESALKTNRNSDLAPKSTCQLYLSLKSVIVHMKIHPLTIFISRFTACHYPNIYH